MRVQKQGFTGKQHYKPPEFIKRKKRCSWKNWTLTYEGIETASFSHAQQIFFMSLEKLT